MQQSDTLRASQETWSSLSHLHLHSCSCLTALMLAEAENVLLADDRCKLADLGLTISQVEEAANTCLGTYDYMAPGVACLPSLPLLPPTCAQFVAVSQQPCNVRLCFAPDVCAAQMCRVQTLVCAELFQLPHKKHPMDNKQSTNVQVCDEKIDTWAVGVLAYESFYGVGPFTGASTASTCANIKRGFQAKGAFPHSAVRRVQVMP